MLCNVKHFFRNLSDCHIRMKNFPLLEILPTVYFINRNSTCVKIFSVFSVRIFGRTNHFEVLFSAGSPQALRSRGTKLFSCTNRNAAVRLRLRSLLFLTCTWDNDGLCVSRSLLRKAYTQSSCRINKEKGLCRAQGAPLPVQLSPCFRPEVRLTVSAPHGPRHYQSEVGLTCLRTRLLRKTLQIRVDAQTTIPSPDSERTDETRCVSCPNHKTGRAFIERNDTQIIVGVTLPTPQINRAAVKCFLKVPQHCQN